MVLRPDSPEVYRELDHAIGLNLRMWGFVEMEISGLIGRLLGGGPVPAQIILNSLPTMRAQLDLARELGKYHLNDEYFSTLEAMDIYAK